MATVLVTGATTGIGRALAVEFLDDGHEVIATARDDVKAARLQRWFRDNHPNLTRGLTVTPVDLARVTTLPPFLAELDGLDAAVLNAGVHVPNRHVKTLDGIEVHEQVNFRSNAAIATALAMRDPTLTIAYMGSNAYRIAQSRLRVGTGFWWRYAKSKFRATVFMAALARCRPDGDTVVISPGSVLTDVHRHKHPLVRRFNEARNIYRDPEQAALEIAGIVLDPPFDAFYWDEGEPQPADPKLPGNIDEMLDDLWSPVQIMLAEIGIEAELELDHAGVAGRVGAPSHLPSTTEEVAAVVRNGPVTVHGSQHSYNDCFAGFRAVDVELLADPAVVDEQAATATVGAGRTVADTLADLHEQGWTLPFSGNHGAQTLAGSISTGTHGYHRDGGVMSELVAAATVVDGRGAIRQVDGGDELKAVRLGLGLCGILTSLDLHVVPAGDSVAYELRTLPAEVFFGEQATMAAEHEWLRAFPLLGRSEVVALTIDRVDEPASEPEFITEELDLPGPLLEGLRSLAFGGIGARLAGLADLDSRVVVPFSADLFARAGLAQGSAWLSRLTYTILNNDRTYNLELGIPPEHLEGFIAALEGWQVGAGADGDFQSYWTARFCGANDATLLAANRGRDTWFVDIHVTRDSPRARAQLAELETRALAEFAARPHWGKWLSTPADRLIANLEDDAVVRFDAVRRELDPDATFLNRFARRHLGLHP